MNKKIKIKKTINNLMKCQNNFKFIVIKKNKL